ncbi:hypothetical protein K490DRAFT_57370 [Saccharata proteae CBS 121410]|uniref:DNA repair protein Swi5/Sae3 n=1 Tax=Saccharata proteae CBS 121410 TaxID=1314787 RepID=A0A9P4HX80_9PEZI|nr:hypothetical protein K490DRAFT_57370 [Saccharata proteae CBS 121410]
MEPALTPEEQETLSAMQARTTTLEATHTELSSRQSTLIRSLAAVPSISATLASTTHADAVIDAAKAVIREHIRLLHDYNEIRDIGQGLMGIIAESRGVRIKEVQDEFDISAKD